MQVIDLPAKTLTNFKWQISMGDVNIETLIVP